MKSRLSLSKNDCVHARQQLAYQLWTRRIVSEYPTASCDRHGLAVATTAFD